MDDKLHKLKKTVNRLSNFGRTRERLFLRRPENITFEIISLTDQLDCRLTPTALDQTFGQRNRSNFKTFVAKTSLFVSSAFLLVAAGYSILNFKVILNSGTESYVDWGLRSFMSISGLSLAGFVSFIILRTEQTRPITHLRDMKFGGFKTAGMLSEFEAFRSWVLEYKPNIGFALTENRLLPIPEDVWHSSDLAIIIFGTEIQRRPILHTGQFALSSLVIKKSDWSAFSTTHQNSKRVTLADRKNIEEVAHQKKARNQKTKKPLSLRQLKGGKDTRWCPRFEMFCLDPTYFQRYKDLGLNINSISVRRQSCHRVLRYFANNPQNVEIFFQLVHIEPDQLDKAKDIDEEVKKELRVEGVSVSSAFNYLKKMKWPTIERHIESTPLISDQMLVNTYPELKPYWESV